MKKLISLLSMISFIFVTGLVLAQSESKTSNKESVPPVMYGFLSNILELQPYLYSMDAFVSDKNQKFVGEHLKNFSDLSEQLKKHDRLQTPGFQVPAKIIIKQLNDVSETYQAGHREFAWRSLRSTLRSCSQCHAQVPQSFKNLQGPTWTFNNENLPKDPMELGDFWFMIRVYDKAFNQFAKVVSMYGKKEVDQFKIKKALRNILTIKLRIEQSPEEALNYLNQINNVKSFPKYLRQDIEAWKNELVILKMLPPMDVKTMDVKEFEKVIEDVLRSVYPIPREGRSKEVALEYGSGLLFDFINHRPKQASQRIYYWLGVSIIELERFDFNSFGDPYLKTCIEKFPPSPISEECYTALEDNWYFGYSGSVGTFLPKANKDELDRLQKIITHK
jgi:hypothetical protein